MSKIAIFPGSFDPWHEGHQRVLNNVINLFDKIYIVVSINSQKKRQFSLEQSQTVILKTISNLTNVKVIINKNRLTIDVAKDLNAKYLIRGIRHQKDFQYEQQLANMNYYLNGDIVTIFTITEHNISKISSTLKKEVANLKTKKPN